MLLLYNTIHKSISAHKDIYFNKYGDLLYGKILPYLSINQTHLWTFMDKNFHTLTLGNHYEKWRFMAYGRVLYYL